MQRKMTVREFGAEFSGREGRYLYSHEDQEYGSPAEHLRFQLEFRSMLVATNPNTIMLKLADNKQMMCIDCVKHVIVDDEDLVVGVVFTVFFGSDDKLNTVKILLI